MEVTAISDIKFKMSPARIQRVSKQKNIVVLELKGGRELRVKDSKNYILDEVNKFYDGLLQRGLYDEKNPLTGYAYE